MAKYVEHEAVLIELCRGCSLHGITTDFFCGDTCPKYERIAAIPAADVRPVVRGVWVKNGWSIRCSVCGYDMPFATRNFCPNCGADMREES